MRLTYIYNACVMVESEGVKVLCDPWLSDKAYYGSWYQYPQPKITKNDLQEINYLYISHIHPDHLDEKSLQLFSREIPIIICNYSHKFMKKKLNILGFENIIELHQEKKLQLNSNLSIEVIAADFCDPKLCQKHFACAPLQNGHLKTQQIDSLAVFQTSTQVLVNLNDVPYALATKALSYIRQSYPKIDFALVGYSGAGPYPQCFDNLSFQEKKIKAALKKKQFLLQSLSFLRALNPSYFMPFAGQYLLGGSLSHLNSLRGVPEIDELPLLFDHYLKKYKVDSELIMLNSAESFDLKTQKRSRKYTPCSSDDRKKFIQKISENLFDYQTQEVDLPFLKSRVGQAYKHLLEFRKRWNYKPKQNLYIDFGSPHCLCLPMDQRAYYYSEELIEPFVKVTIDPRLFTNILLKKAHWNNAEIGSHLIFDRKPDVYDRSLYLTLAYFHC